MQSERLLLPYVFFMASTFTRILLHITFSTKDREPLIAAAMEPNLFAYVGGICRRLESPLLAMGAATDHVYMLVSLSKNVTLVDLMLNVKRDSSKWMKAEYDTLPMFNWQDGYFAFSIGESGIEATKAYIAKQRIHHETVDFKDEMREFLKRHNLEWNEDHIWK
jgi:putative transposase